MRRTIILLSILAIMSPVPALADARDDREAAVAAIHSNPRDGAAHLRYATALLAIGDGVGAEAAIGRARDHGVPEAASRHLLAQALLLEGEPQRALDALDGGVAPAHAAAAARMRGRARLALGDPAAAAAAFGAALRLASDDVRTWTDVGRFRMATGELAGALAAGNRAISLAPRDPEALILKGELVRQQYGLRASLVWFDRALAIDARNVPALIEKAATLGDMGAARAMLATVRAARAHDPANPRALYLLAVLAARSGQYDLARTLMQRTGDALDDMPAAMMLVAGIDYRDGNFEQAIERLDRLLGLQPDNAAARRLLGAAQFQAHDPAGAIRTLNGLNDSYSLMLLARAWEALGDRIQAADYLDRVARPDRAPPLAAATDAAEDDGPIARIAHLRALLAEGRGEDALGEATRLRDANPGAPAAHMLVGDTLAALGRWGEAAGAYRTAANISFTEPVALRFVEALRKTGDTVGAGRVLATFLQQNPANMSALMLAAGLEMDMARWGEAAAIYESLRKRLGDGDAALLNNLAWARLRGGQGREALVLAERAYALDPANPALARSYGVMLTATRADVRRGRALIEQARLARIAAIG